MKVSQKPLREPSILTRLLRPNRVIWVLWISVIGMGLIVGVGSVGAMLLMDLLLPRAAFSFRTYAIVGSVMCLMGMGIGQWTGRRVLREVVSTLLSDFLVVKR